jgi:hypothetical protein
MEISIAGRIRPYSHSPGTRCVLPGSLIGIQVFPTLLRVEELSPKASFPKLEIKLDLQAPVKDFTVLQDLEKGFIHVWGNTEKGFVRYRITSLKGGLAIKIEKAPEAGIAMLCSEKELLKINEEGKLKPLDTPAKEKDLLLLTKKKKFSNQELFNKTVEERLSLGNHKAQDWDMVTRRMDLREVFPAWLRLGQMTPELTFTSELKGTATLFEQCAKVHETGNTENLHQAYTNLFKAGFEGILSPSLVDFQHQGFSFPEHSKKLPSFVLLKEGAKYIKDCLIKVQGQNIDILPQLLPEFYCGRYLNVDCGGIATVDLEWTKKRIRRLSCLAEKDGEIRFKFHRQLASFRMRRGKKDRGQTMRCGEAFSCRAGEYYFLDNFKK